MFENVRISVLSGRRDQAMELLKTMVEEEPDNYRAWSGLAVLAAEVDDVETVEEAVQRLESQRQYYPVLASALAQIAIRRENYDKARSYYEAILKIRPGYVPTLEQLLRLDVQQGYRSRAERHVEMILNKDASNALANYILGSLQYVRGQDALAEESYRASIKKERSPMVLNDLAFLLQKRGALEESLSLIEESLALNERNPMAWDTYGVTLMELGRYDEAEDALNKALALLPNYTPVLLNLALLYEKRGLTDQALEMAVPLRDRIAEMDPADVDQLRDLIQRLRSQRNAMR
jgi:tetratricopeptide (TPR) repeat protein